MTVCLINYYYTKQTTLPSMMDEQVWKYFQVPARKKLSTIRTKDMETITIASKAR
ncbi:hypothetical protein [Paenibacillus qinlingensis]|uniref:hypothetical protein n=1 Tax=Paenibacillus qinlingensis TaxID=1837343 RepID=UPI00286CAAED|nr:hypothetical protein [Paenibacillus qinlingensis]